MKVLLVDDPIPVEREEYVALFQLWETYATKSSESVRTLLEEKYDLVVLNAAKTDNATLLVARIYFQSLCSRVVVVTRNPSWRMVREIFHAGATDCLTPDAPLGVWRKIIDQAATSKHDDLC